MDRGMYLSLLVFEGISFLATYYVPAREGQGFIRLHCYSTSCSEPSTCWET